MISQRSARLLPLLVGAVALLVAGWGVWTPGLWRDEVATLIAADRSWGSLATMLRQVDAVHGAYYVLMHGWVSVAGTSAWALRAPSVLAVAATAGVLTVFGQRLWGPVAGVLTGLAFVAIPRTLWMATEARSYALATLLTTVAVYAFWRALHERGWTWSAIYCLATLLAGWVFVYSILVVPGLLLAARWAGCESARTRRLWTATAVALLAVAPLVVLVAGQRGQVAWIETLTVTSVWIQPLGAFLGGKTPPGHAALWGVLVAGCLALWARRLVRSPSRESTTLLVLFGGWLLLPVVVLVGVGFALPLWSPRYASFAVPALALLVAGAVSVRGPRPWGVGLLVVALAVLAYPSWSGWRQPEAKGELVRVVEIVEAERRPGDAIWFGSPHSGSDTSARIVRYASPHVFTGMHDITLDETFEDSGDLWETQIPLAEVDEEVLAGSDRLIGVIQADYPGAPADLALLSRAGFTEVGRDTAGPWVVLVLERR